MEARDEPGRIRPLPPELADDAASEDSSSQPDRRWVPIAVAGSALVFFGLLAGLFGAGNEPAGDAGSAAATATTLPSLGGEEPPSTTTTAAPPTLRQMASVLERPVHILYRDFGDATTSRVTWELDAIEPSEPLTSGAMAVEAAYDASYEQAMWITQGQTDTLWVGQPPIAEPVFVDVAGAHWHPALPRSLAWVGTPPGSGMPRLYRATSPSTPGLDGLLDLGTVPFGSELIGWGDWGFVLRVPVPISQRRWEVPDPSTPGATTVQVLEFTLVLGPLGAPVATVAGTPHAVGPNGELVVQPANEAFAAAMAGGFDAAQVGITLPATPVTRGPAGEPIVVLGPALQPTGVAFEPISRNTTFLFTPDGAHIAAMGEREGRYAITTEAIDGTARRITSVEEVDTAIGFSRDGSLLILHHRDRGDIVFHDWNRGASFRIPFDGGRVLAIDV